MKKPTVKLVVRRETLRVLAGVELTRAVGGDVTLLFQSDEKHCPEAIRPAVVPPAG
jgi:hypothetical protein